MQCNAFKIAGWGLMRRPYYQYVLEDLHCIESNIIGSRSKQGEGGLVGARNERENTRMDIVRGQGTK